MKNMIVFSKYTVKGMRDSWFVEEGKGAEYIKDWQEILKILDDGTKKGSNTRWQKVRCWIIPENFMTKQITKNRKDGGM